MFSNIELVHIYQWMVSTSTGYIQWLSLVKSEFEMTLASKGRSLVTHTNKCRCVNIVSLGVKFLYETI